MPNRLVLLALLVGVLTAPVHAQELPDHVGKVNDFAGVLDAGQRTALDAQLADLERATSAEVAVVTMRTLGGQTVEEYATALFNAWGIGKADRDNGVLILVALQERAMRIEVGYGLEGVLPDGLAGAVIRETFTPPFVAGDYRRGLLEGTARIIDIVRRNETLTPEQRAALDAAAAEAGKTWFVAAVASPFVAAAAFAFGTAAGARVVVQMLFGLVVAVGGVFGASLGEATRTSLALLVLLAVAVAVWGYRLGRRPKWRRAIRGSGKGAGGSSGWIVEASGSSSSSSSDSGSSSSGDFGGGSSGGGGASGHW
ncbi:MAG: TPM domain-containing protein [Vicinamibacterales bacterium]